MYRHLGFTFAHEVDVQQCRAPPFSLFLRLLFFLFLSLFLCSFNEVIPDPAVSLARWARDPPLESVSFFAFNATKRPSSLRGRRPSSSRLLALEKPACGFESLLESSNRTTGPAYIYIYIYMWRCQRLGSLSL